MSAIPPTNIYDTIGRITPWSDWTEWYQVYIKLYSNNPVKIHEALQTVQAWRIRAPLAHSVDSTAYLVEALLLDKTHTLSDQAISHILSSCVSRFVAGLLDKGQRGTVAVSMYTVAENFNFPKILVDIRHTIAHNALPPVSTLRYAALQSLNWIQENYWIPQIKVILEREQELKSLFEELLDSDSLETIKKTAKKLIPRLNVTECRSIIPSVMLDYLYSISFMEARYKILAIFEAISTKNTQLVQHFAVRALSLKNLFGLKVFNVLVTEFSSSIEPVLNVLPLAVLHILTVNSSDEIIKVLKSIIENIQDFDYHLNEFLSNIVQSIEHGNAISIEAYSTLLVEKDDFTPAAALEDYYKLPCLGVSRNFFKKDFLNPPLSCDEIMTMETPQECNIATDGGDTAWWTCRTMEEETPEIGLNYSSAVKKVYLDPESLKVF